MRSPFLVFSIFVVLAACSELPAGQITSSSNEIQGGEASVGDPAVGILLMPDGGFCTGTLIAADVVLTAGHCIAPQPIWFGTSLDSPSASTKYVVADRIAHPSYARGGCPNAHNDVGLVHLRTPVTDIAPVAWDGAATEGETCRAIGYGQHGEDSGATTRMSKREAESAVTSIDGSHVAVTWGTGIADHGDSGGPLLCGGKIAAVVSCHNDGEGPSHRNEVYEDIARDRDWITAKLAEWAAAPVGVDAGVDRDVDGGTDGG